MEVFILFLTFLAVFFQLKTAAKNNEGILPEMLFKKPVNIFALKLTSFNQLFKAKDVVKGKHLSSTAVVHLSAHGSFLYQAVSLNFL